MKNNNKITLYIIIFVLSVASIVFRTLSKEGLEQTSLLFVGVPALITILIVRYTKKPKSAYGVAFLTITLFLLLCGILFGEGLVCIIFMAPIFYGVTAILVWFYEFLKKIGKNKTYAIAILPILMLLFQPNELVSEPKIHSIITIQEISENQDLSKLKLTPNLKNNLPVFFKIGFPKPLKIEGNGLNVGDIRTIDFKSNTKGIGQLVLEIKEKSYSKIIFKIKSDNTHINHWLTYKEIKIELVEENGVNKIVWTTDFICDLGPSWYFEPFEKYAVSLMNKHLIASYFN
ncbi:MAG: hypothetical protein AB8B78_03350 [Polaribacter sp.]